MSDDGATRAAVWLSAWDSQGIHRTATAGDEAGAAWLMREAAGLGAAPAAEDFALDRIDPVDAYFECAGERIPGVPVFDSPGTGPEGIAGTLAPIGGPVAGQATIAVAELSPFNVYSPDYEKVRRDTACSGPTARPGQPFVVSPLIPHRLPPGGFAPRLVRKRSAHPTLRLVTTG